MNESPSIANLPQSANRNGNGAFFLQLTSEDQRLCSGRNNKSSIIRMAGSQSKQIGYLSIDNAVPFARFWHSVPPGMRVNPNAKGIDAFRFCQSRNIPFRTNRQAIPVTTIIGGIADPSNTTAKYS